MAVRPHDGALVDITGANRADSVGPGYRVIPMTAALEEHIAADRQWAAPNLEVARTFVRPLLNSLGTGRRSPQAPHGGNAAGPTATTRG